MEATKCKRNAALAFGFVLLFWVGIVACTSDDQENEQMKDELSCELVYSSFVKVLGGLDEIDLNTEDGVEYVNTVLSSLKEKNIVDPSVFEYSRLITKSTMGDFDSNGSAEGYINELSSNLNQSSRGRFGRK